MSSKSEMSSAEEKYREIFSNYIGLRQYLVENKIGWKKRQIAALEKPVLMAYQMISNETFYLCAGKDSGYVFPRHFLETYIGKITHGDTKVQAFESYFLFGLNHLNAVILGLRVTLEQYIDLGSTAEDGYEGHGADEIKDMAKNLVSTLCFPTFMFVCLHQITGEIEVEPEYPYYFLMSVDCELLCDREES